MLKLEEIRLNKFISESGICSRREADRFIEQGNVFINGRRAAVGDRVGAGDKVKVNGQSIEPREAEDLIFIVLNKPIGVVSTTESSEKNNIVDFVRHSTRIFPIGRLDKDSQGLIFLTNNGDLVNKILRAGNNHEKEYLVTVNKPITDRFIEGMSQGVPIMGVVTKKCKVEKVSPTSFRITLIQGLNRQIRRMCDHFNYDAVKLERVRIMNVSLKGLALGEWRDLKQQELSGLLALVEESTSEAKPGAKKQVRKSRPGHGKNSGRPQTGERSKTGKPSFNKSRSGGGKSKPSGSGKAKVNFKAKPSTHSKGRTKPVSKRTR
jgi:23S rRNA pseudouridine2604 synthase